MDRMAWIFGVLLFGVCLVAAEDIQEEVEGGKCERIKLPLCQDLGYNWTAMPNLLGHKDQKEAEEAMAAFADILESGCSEHSRFVVCSAFAPLCSEQVTGAVAACRALCERAAARDACGARLAAAGLPCAAFPLRADRRLCMRPPNASERVEPPPAAPVAHPAPWAPPALVVPGAALCPPVPSAGLALPALAWLSLLTTLAALLTFCAEPGRYRQPERPAVWLAACQLVVAAAHVARGWLGPATVCGGLAPGPTDGLGPPGCVAFFAVTYYFTLAADAWLANACGAWYLTAASEWSTEALERAAAYLHAVAWGWAGAWTAAALALRRVAAGAGGACGVADAAAAAQLLVPRAAPLLAALALGAAAAPGVRRVRRALGARGARRVGRLAARAAAVGLLYVLLAALSLGLRLVEARARVALSDAGGIAGPWSLAGSGPAAGAGSAAGVGSAAAALACGVVAAAWAWSRESAAAWRRALCPPRKARVLPPPLLPPPHPYCKRPLHVSRV